MICEQCKRHISREFASLDGKTTNCLAYGCDNYDQTGLCCNPYEIIEYIFKRLKEKKNEEGKRT